MPEVSDSESDGDSMKRQLNTQRARLFAAAAPIVPSTVAQAGDTSSADMSPARRQRLEGVVHTSGKNSVKRIGIADLQYHLIDGSFAQPSTTSFIVDRSCSRSDLSGMLPVVHHR